MIKHPSNVEEFASNKPAANAAFLLSGTTHTDKRTFVAALTNGDQCPVHATNGVDWMDFVGTFASGSPNSVAVTSVLESSTGSAIDWSSGGTVRLSVAWLGTLGQQAARIQEDTFKYVVDAAGNKYALLPVDALGNVIASIGHRQNTYDNLVGLDGVSGEISIATDVPTLFAHNGAAGQAVAFDNSFHREGTAYRGGISGALGGALGARAIDIQSQRTDSSYYAKGDDTLAFGRNIKLESPYTFALGADIVQPPGGVITSFLLGFGITLPDAGSRNILMAIAPTIGTGTANNVAIGVGPTLSNSCLGGVAIGFTASVMGSYGVAYGNAATAGQDGVAVGRSANAGTTVGNIAIGADAAVGASADHALAIGKGLPNAAYCGVICVGPNQYSSTSANALTAAATATTGALSCNLRLDAVKGEVTLGGKGTKIRVPSTADLSTYGQTLTANQYMQFEMVSNTQLKINLRGTDGVIRSATLTLA